MNLDEDVAAAVDQLRRERGLGLSEAINELARAGLAGRPPRKRFVQKTVPMGLLIDVTDIAEALEFLEGPHHK